MGGEILGHGQSTEVAGPGRFRVDFFYLKASPLPLRLSITIPKGLSMIRYKSIDENSIYMDCV